MAFKIDFVEDINKKMTEKRFPNDVQETIFIPEHKFKKIASKFNYALRAVYEENKKKDVKMYQIVLSLHEHFDIQWLVETILSKENKVIVKAEMNQEISEGKKHGTTKKK